MSKQCLDVQQMQHLQELGLDTTRFASVCHYKTFFSYYFGEDTSTEWCVDFLYKYTERNGDITLSPKNFAGIPDNDGRDYADVQEIIPSFTLQDIFDLLPKEISREGCTWSASLYIDYENNRIAYGNTDREGFEIYHEIMIEKDLIDAAYSMLCWAIDNKFVETNKNK